jgi:hypothetical protein
MSRRLTRLTGIAFAVTILVSEVLKGDSPSPTGPPSEIVSFFADHRSTILAGAYVQMLALFLLALLFATVSEHVMPADTGAGRLARLGLVLTLVAYTTYVFLTAALAFGAATDTTAETAKALWEIRFVSETFVNVPVALLIGSVAFAIRPASLGPGFDGDRWSSPRRSSSEVRPWRGTDSSRRTVATDSSSSGSCRSGWQ